MPEHFYGILTNSSHPPTHTQSPPPTFFFSAAPVALTATSTLYYLKGYNHVLLQSVKPSDSYLTGNEVGQVCVVGERGG